MNIDLNELESAAKAATPGPWVIDPRNCDIVIRYADGGDVAEAQRISNAGNDAYYIAAADPATVLELIEELRQARAERDWIAHNIRANDVGPCACPSRVHWLSCESIDDRSKEVCVPCWLRAAKEAIGVTKNGGNKK